MEKKRFSDLFSVPVANLSIFECEVDSRRRNELADSHCPRIFIVKVLKTFHRSLIKSLIDNMK